MTVSLYRNGSEVTFIGFLNAGILSYSFNVPYVEPSDDYYLVLETALDGANPAISYASFQGPLFEIHGRKYLYFMIFNNRKKRPEKHVLHILTSI